MLAACISYTHVHTRAKAPSTYSVDVKYSLSIHFSVNLSEPRQRRLVVAPQTVVTVEQGVVLLHNLVQKIFPIPVHTVCHTGLARRIFGKNASKNQFLSHRKKLWKLTMHVEVWSI